MAPILTEDLGRQCFLGYEDADAEELRGMVHLFMEQAGKVGEQQRRAFAQLASTTETVSMAQKRLQQLYTAEVDAEAHAASLAHELQGAHAELRVARGAEAAAVGQRDSAVLASELAVVESALSAERTGRAERSAAAEMQADGLRDELTAHASRTAELSRVLAATEAALAEEAARGLAGQAEAAAARERSRGLYEELRGRERELGTTRQELAEGSAGARSHTDSLSSELASAEATVRGLSARIAAMEQTAARRSAELLQRESTSVHGQAAAVACPGAEAISGSTGRAPNFRYQNVEVEAGPELFCEETLLPTEVVREQQEEPRARALGVVQDAAADTSARAKFKAALAAPGSCAAVTAAASGSATARSSTRSVCSTSCGGDDDVVTDAASEGCLDASAAGVLPGTSTLVHSHEAAKGTGLRYLLGRRQSQPTSSEPPQEEEQQQEQEVPEPEANRSLPQPELPDEEGGGESLFKEGSEGGAEDTGKPLLASWAGADPRSSTGALVDRLYDECLARGGGQLRGAAAVQRVLLDLAGGECPGEPQQLGMLLGGLGASVDAEVSRAQFRQLVQEALSLRQSQELRQSRSPPERLSWAGAEARTGDLSLADAAGLSSERKSWNDAKSSMGCFPAALPAWSLELPRESCAVESSLTALEGSAAEHWRGVEGALERLSVLGGTAWEPLLDLRQQLAAFVRGAAAEARIAARDATRGARAAAARLLERRRSAADELGTQLEERDAELQRKAEECAGLAARLRAAQATAARAEAAAEAAALRAEAAEARPARPPRRLEEDSWAGDTAMPRESHGQLALQPATEHFEAELQLLHDELRTAEEQRDAAEASSHSLQRQLEALAASYDEDARTFQQGLNRCSAAVTPEAPCSLQDELQDVLRCSMVRRAEEAELKLREELHAARGELERRDESLQQAQREQDDAAAAAGEAAQEHLVEMHGGAWFEKVSFRRQVRQPRFARLTFDLKRVEWGQSERGPLKVLPVDAILRVDFGDASRSFRCFEHAKWQHRPRAALCLSITTPSRSLDLIAESERVVETWVLGLNEVVPYRPERQRFTAQEFWLRRALLRLEEPQADAECETASGCSSRPDAISSATPSVRSGASSEGQRAGVRRLLPGRWGG